MGVAGVFFGILVGWIVGSQQGGTRPSPSPSNPAPSQSSAAGSAPATPQLDEARASAMKTTAQQNPTDAVTRVELGDSSSNSAADLFSPAHAHNAKTATTEVSRRMRGAERHGEFEVGLRGCKF